MYINEYTATKNTIQEVLRSHDRPVSLENLVHELRQRVPNYLILFPKKELLVAYIASVLKKEIASCCIYDTKRKKTIPRYFLRNSRVAKAIGVTGTFHPAVDGVSAFADAMFSVYNGTDNTHVAFSDVKKLYKKRTGRALTNGELNSIAGTAGVTRMNVLRDHLSHLVTVVNDHFEQVSCPAFYGTARDFFETQIWPEKYNPTETARVRELFKSFNEAAANDAPEEIDVDEDEGEITLADIKVNESFNASTTSYESSDMSAGLDQSLLASAEPPSPRPTSGDLASSGLATIQEDDHERQAAKDREFAEQAALLVQEREARLAAEAEAAKERERIAAEVREREERERKAFEELERVRQEEEEQQRLEAERLEAEKREQEAEEKRQRELKEEEERKRLAAEKLEREAAEKRERQRKEKEERDRKAAEKRQREAAEKRERELKEEAERKRLENEKREREAEAERKRLEAEKLELEAAAERKRLEDEKREREAEAERKRLEAEAAQKREQERKAEEERKRLEAEKLEREAAAERKRLEAEKLEREAAAERKRLEAEAEEKRQREAAEKREQERKAEEERKRLEAEKLEREAAAERKRLEDEKRELEAAAERKRLEAEAEEKRQREAEAERKRLEAEAEEKRQHEAAQKREQERKAEEERQRLEKEKRDREAEEKRQRDAAEKRERELKEEAERKRLENEKREREAEAERKRLEAEKLEREAAAERKRLEDEKREREAEAERKRLEAEAEEKRQLEAAQKREQERKAEEERQRLEKEKRDREAAAERKRLEDEKRELEAAAERKRLEAQAEEKRQREATEKRERELKEEAERKRRETEKREREAAKKLERKRKEQEARDRKAAEKRERERKEKEERDAAEQRKREAAQKLFKEEEEQRERAAATKRENEAAEEQQRLEAAQREPIAVEVDSTSRLGSQSSPLHIVEQLSPRYDPSDTEAINDYAQSQQTGSESSSPKPNSDVLFAHMREELIEKHAAHSIASYGSTSNGMAVSDFSPLPQANRRDSVFGETSGRTDSPVQKLNPSSDLEYAQFGIRRSAPRASDSTRATVASSSTSSMSLDVDNTQASDGTGEFSYSQAVSQLQSADAADNASDSLSMDYNELAAAPLRATRLFGLSAGNGSESSPQVSPTSAVPHHDHTVNSVTYADAVKEDATQALSDASVGSGTSSPNRRQRQDTVVDFSYVDAANPDRVGTAAAEDSFGSSNGDKENVPVHHDHVVVDLSYAEAAKLDGTVEEGIKQSVTAPLGAAPSENELESVVVTSPGEDQAFEHHDHVTSTLSYAGAVKHAAPEAGDVNDPETENEIYTDKPFDNYLILRLLTGFEHGIIKSLDSESLPAFFRDYVEQDIDPVQTWNLTWENVVDNWGKLDAFDYRDGVLYPNEATKVKASAHDEAGCGDCEILTRTDAEIVASISQFHGSEAQFQPHFNDDDDYDVHSVYEDEIVPFSTDIEPIPKCDAMKDDEVHTGPKSCLTIRTPKSKTAASRVDQTGEVAPVNFSSSTSPKSTQPKHNGQPMLQKAAELQEVALKAPPPTPSEYVVNEDNDVFLPGDEQEHPQHGEHERSGLNCFHLPRFSTKSKNGSSSSNKSPVDKNASVVVPMEPEPVSVVVDEEDPETAPTTGTANELLDASGTAATTADNSAADDDLEDGNRAVGISRRYCKCCTII